MQNKKDGILRAEHLLIWADSEIINITFVSFESSTPQMNEKLWERRMSLQ